MCTVKFVKMNDAEFESVADIRKTVFIDEQGANRDEEFDLFDNNIGTDYCIVLCKKQIVGTGRLVRNENEYKIGRIAILKEYRGKHLGDLLVNSLIDKALKYGTNELFVDAQIHAIPFYEKLGFKAFDSDIIDRGIIHRPMKLNLENTYEK